MTVFLKNLDLSKIRSHRNRLQGTSFPIKLFQMLDSVERDGLEHIVSWNLDGRSFQVHNVRVFVETVLPSHFKQTKYKSFQRQLNFYGFERIKSGPLAGSYQHASFIKGNEKLCKNVKKQIQQQQTSKSAAAISNHNSRSSYFDWSSESAEVEKAEAPTSSDTTNAAASAKSETPTIRRRRDSYHMAMELIENYVVPARNGRRDSFHQAISTIAESRRRGSFADSRLSFVGQKFHALQSDFVSLYDDE